MTTHSARLQLAISQAFKEMNEMTEEEFRQAIEEARDDPSYLTILYALDFTIAEKLPGEKVGGVKE